jgi:putative ABC transport system permease protein
MQINAMPYTVIGVLEKRMQMGTYGGPDKNHAVIPITTFQAQIGRKYLANLVVRATDPAMMKTALDEITKVFAGKYGFDPADDRDRNCLLIVGATDARRAR